MKFRSSGDAMLEPKYRPELNERVSAIPYMRFSAVRNREYMQPNDPDADPLHVHSSLEIFINVSSDISFLVNNSLYHVPVGDAVISRPDDIHMGIFQKASVQDHVCIWIDADLSLPIFAFLRDADFSPLFSFDEETKGKLRSLAISLVDACKGKSSELEKISYLFRILSLFEKNKLTGVSRAGIPDALQSVLDDINENFSNIRSINDVIESHFVSSATLTRWFRKYLHTSPREYLESVRLSNAALLLSNGRSVTDACMLSGFSDCSHFIALFKSKFGQTPLKYKKSNTSKF